MLLRKKEHFCCRIRFMKILYEMVFIGEHDGLHAVARIDFRQNMRHMRFHRRQADEKLVGNLSISTSRSRSVSSSNSGSVYAGAIETEVDVTEAG